MDLLFISLQKSCNNSQREHVEGGGGGGWAGLGTDILLGFSIDRHEVNMLGKP